MVDLLDGRSSENGNRRYNRHGWRRTPDRMRDVDIRRQLRSDMERQHRGDPETLILDELGLCQGTARVDLAVVNGNLHGYEIKSERDTLTRLPSQREIYSRALDYVTVVVAETHAAKIAEAIPAWWGITTARATKRGAVRLTVVRPAAINPSVDAAALAQLLWREEALDELERRGLAGGFRSKPRAALWAHLAANLTIEELGDAVRGRLKQRLDWRAPERPTSGGGSSRPSAT